MGKSYRKISTEERLSNCQKIAETKGGKCLSKSYKNTSTKMIWQCKYGHEWEAASTNVVYKGKWCPICAGNKKLTINDAHKLAADKGGRCLSSIYINSASKLKWQCKFNHIWEQTYNNIQQGSWCPYCSGYIGERIVRLYFELYFKKPFIKTRPDWLKCKKNMELDGFNEQLKIAFEYNGPQHYEDSGHFKSENIKKRDLLKNKICKEMGVKLITIPYVNKNNLSKFISVIESEFVKNGFSKKNIHINESDIYFDKLEEFIKIASDNDGECLSSDYSSRLKFKCKFGHEWETSSSSVKNGHWCPYCSKNKKLTIDEAREIAKSNNGKCLSETYINIHEKLLWKCECGHRWEASLASVKHSKSWCPICSAKEKFIKKWSK